MSEKPQPAVSVIIKALNEEKHIAAAIESALGALRAIDGEVILADARSSDRTIEIARRYPIKIVQLNKLADRSCGSGAQLGFQYSSGRYLCLIDGDMELHGDFLAAAMRLLEVNPILAGVGGNVVDCEIANLEFEQRNKRGDPDRHNGRITRLNGCGLYRRSAIEAIGYLTDRNLHGAEEFDLGARLLAHGWRLARIDRPAVDHHGHTGSAYHLLLRRVVTRNSFATGELVRAAIRQPQFWLVGKDRNCLLCFLVAGWWMTMLAAPLLLSGFAALLATGALLLLPLAAMSMRWRSLHHGLYSLAAWNVYALSFLPGFLRSRVAPTRWIDSTVIQERPVASGTRPLGPRSTAHAQGCAEPARS